MGRVLMWEPLGLDILLFLLAFLSSLLYVWLGVAYSLTLISLLTLLGVPVNTLMPPILASQAFSALLGSLYRTAQGRREVGRDDARGILLMGVSSLVAFFSALLLGVRLPGDARSLVAIVILLVSGGAMLLAFGRRSVCGEKPRVSVGASQLASGVLGGLVKGVVGAGVTPVMLILQMLACVEFSRVVYRTVFSEVGLLFATFVPYAFYFGVDAETLLFMLGGAMIGVVVGGMGSVRALVGARGVVLSGGIMMLLGLVSLLALFSRG